MRNEFGVYGSGKDIVLADDDGADSLTGGGGNDTLYGGAGCEALAGGAWDDFLFGKGGIDTFTFDDGFGRDVVKDFVDGADLMDFNQHSGVTSLSDLTIVQSGANTLISLSAGGTDLITLADTIATDIGSDDFLF